MGIFDKKPKEQPAVADDGATYDQVVDFLVSVNDRDYQKIKRVVDIYRAANVEVAKATGVRSEPANSIFAKQTVPAVNLAPSDTDVGNFLEDDDELTAAFLEDDEPAPKPKARRGK